MSKQQQEDNRAQLEERLRAANGDLRTAARAYMAHRHERPRYTLAELARASGVGRKNVDMCLGASYGRKYHGTRRALEVAMGLPQYALDAVVDLSVELRGGRSTFNPPAAH